MTKFRILSYNIHKGFSASRLNFVLERIKESIKSVDADVVLLQEVQGHHESSRSRIRGWPTASQFEFLADQVWPHYAYGKNAVYTQGHHGNAILSKFPISRWENIDVSSNRFERRGLLHAELSLPGASIPLHVVCLHLALFEAGRKAQIGTLCDRIESLVESDSPLIVGGDFNDWGQKVSQAVYERLKLKEAFLELNGQHAKTFPSWLPILRLDRIYYRALQPLHVQVLTQGIWSELSDHAALYCELECLPDGSDSRKRDRVTADVLVG